jgi:hypothetical protein
MSEQEQAGWLLDLASSCPLGGIADRGIPSGIQRWAALASQAAVDWALRDGVNAHSPQPPLCVLPVQGRPV